MKRGIADFRIPKLQQRGPKKNKNWRNCSNFYTHCNMRWAKRNTFLIKEGLSFDGPLKNYVQEGDVDESE